MSEKKTCGRCGAEMLEETAGGLCPRCLMGLNFDSQTMPEGEAAPTAAPLSPEEMRERFPQFEVLECLGRGGMGVVYKARQKSLNRLVAIKILAPEKFGDEKFSERFAREAQTLALLNHPNIVTVFDYGETEGLFYIVMEYVDGVNLRDLLRDGKLESQQALAIVPPICEALQYAHNKGIVHRDIKPENLLLDRDGRVKIADFGIASLVGATGEKSGTPPYMAPEQGSVSIGTDHRADIYALGVVLYEMLTGERPEKSFDTPSKKVAIDVRLDEMVLRALEKEPERRYQTADEFRTVVETVAGDPQPKTAESNPAPPVAEAIPLTPLPRWVENWIRIPVERRRTLFAFMCIAGFGMTVAFCIPSHHWNSETGLETWSYGLGAPWYESVRDFTKQLNYCQIHLNTIAFALGALAFIHWIAFALLSHAETRAGSRLSPQDRIFAFESVEDRGGRRRVYWWRALARLFILWAALSVWAFMGMALMTFALGHAPSPGSVTSFTAIISLLVTGFMVLYSVKKRSASTPPPLHKRSSGLAIAIGCGVVALLGLLVIPLIILTLFLSYRAVGVNESYPAESHTQTKIAVPSPVPAKKEPTPELTAQDKYRGTRDIDEFAAQFRKACKKGSRPFVQSMILREALNPENQNAAIALIVPQRPTDFAKMTVESIDERLRSKPHSFDHLPDGVKPRYVLRTKYNPEVGTAGKGSRYSIKLEKFFPVVEKDGKLYIGAFNSAVDSTRDKLMPEKVPETPSPKLEGSSSSHLPSTGLQFRWVAAGDDADSVVDLLADPGDATGQRKLRVLREVVIAHDDMTGTTFTKRSSDDGNADTFTVRFTKAGGQKLKAATAANIGRQLAIVLNGRVISSPIIQAAIGDGIATISGRFTDAESKQLLNALNSNPDGSASPPAGNEAEQP